MFCCAPFRAFSCAFVRAFRPHLASSKIRSCEENFQAWAWKSKGFGGLKGSLWAGVKAKALASEGSGVCFCSSFFERLFVRFVRFRAFSCVFVRSRALLF